MTPGNRLRVLMVGIDGYGLHAEGKSEGGAHYKSLAGCVRDALAMRAYFSEEMGVPDERLTTLLAPEDGPPQPGTIELPTYERLTGALQRLLQESQPDEQVIFFFAGHGGRSPTRFPELKGAGGWDEGLVPVDISQPNSQYLRDVELSFWLARMAERGVFTSLFLDCCHSGGARRQKNLGGVVGMARSNDVESCIRQRPSALAPRERLIASWRDALMAPDSRPCSSGWHVAPPAGHVVLAACGTHQTAFEYRPQQGACHGAFTFCLLHALRQRGPHVTARDLHRRVKKQLYRLFQGDQTPQLEGDGERLLFAPRYRRRLSTLEVIDRRENWVLLGAGQAQGLREGMRLHVFPSDWNGEQAATARCAVVEVVRVGAVEAEAEVIEDGPSESKGVAGQALPIDPMWRTLRLHVPQGSPELLAVVDRLQLDDLDGVTIAETGATADWRISLDDRKHVRLVSADGSEIFQVPSAGHWQAPGTPRAVMKHLQHLTRFHRVEEVQNHDVFSSLQNQLDISLYLLADDYVRGERIQLDSSFEEDTWIVAGQWVCLSIENPGEFPIHVAVLDLQPRFSIRQLFPFRSDSYLLEPGGLLEIPLKSSLPEGLEAGRDLLKIFATLDSTSYGCLEMPPIGGALRNVTSSLPPNNGLDALLASMVTGQFARRDLSRADANEEWTVETKALWIRETARAPSDRDAETEHRHDAALARHDG